MLLSDVANAENTTRRRQDLVAAAAGTAPRTAARHRPRTETLQRTRLLTCTRGWGTRAARACFHKTTARAFGQSSKNSAERTAERAASAAFLLGIARAQSTAAHGRDHPSRSAPAGRAHRSPAPRAQAPAKKPCTSTILANRSEF